MIERKAWSREEQLAAFCLYCRTPFGKLHAKNPEIIALAARLKRTPSAVAMKACNFASLDPVVQARGVSGLGNVARADRELWSEFAANPTSIAELAESAFESAVATEIDREDSEVLIPSGPTESLSLVRVRLVQTFFRNSVLASYENRCAISGVTIPSLLVASHIIPWSANESRRADPRNGVCLNSLYDKAFDRGLVTFSDDLKVVVSPVLRAQSPSQFHQWALLDIEGASLNLPARFAPDPISLAFHREYVFQSA